MATLPVIANVYRVALDGRIATGGSSTNVLHFRGAPGSAAGLYTAIDANVTVAMWIFQTAVWRVVEVSITPLDGTSATVINAPAAVAKWTGAEPSDPIPQAANILKLRTAKRGKSYRGRIFLPFVAENEQDTGTLIPIDVASCTAAWTTFRTAVAAAGYTLVVASYLHATAETVTTAACEPMLGTQRRRMSRLR